MSLTFALVSDLHLEGSNASLALGRAQLLAAVGDIYAPPPGMKRGSMHPAVDWLDRNASDIPTLFVPGNHDYEGHRVFDALEIMRESAKGTNVHVLWNEAFEFGGVRFLGTPLFTDFSLDDNLTQSQLDKPIVGTDMAKSFDENGHPLTGRWMIEQYRIARQFLSDELDRDPSIPKVVLTHWCPTRAGQDHRFDGERNNGYWICPCEDLARKANVWCHGHVHETVDIRVGSARNKGRIVSNPRGFSKFYNLASNRNFVQPKLICV